MGWKSRKSLSSFQLPNGKWKIVFMFLKQERRYISLCLCVCQSLSLSLHISVCVCFSLHLCLCVRVCACVYTDWVRGGTLGVGDWVWETGYNRC